MALDIWFMGYTFSLAARVLLYDTFRQDSTYHKLCYTSCGAIFIIFENESECVSKSNMIQIFVLLYVCLKVIYILQKHN